MDYVKQIKLCFEYDINISDNVDLLIEKMTPEYLVNNIDAEEIKSIYFEIDISHNRYAYIEFLYRIFDKNVNVILNDKKYNELFFDLLFGDYGNFNVFSYDSLLKIFSYMEKNKIIPYKIQSYFFRKLDTERQKELLGEPFSGDFLRWLLNSCDVELFRDFFSNNLNAKYMYLYFDIEDFIKMNVKLNTDILYQENFFDKLKNTSLVIFRDNLNFIMSSSPSYVLEEKAKKYVDEMINSLDMKTCKFKIYEGIEDKNSYFERIQINDYLLNNADIAGYLLNKYGVRSYFTMLEKDEDFQIDYDDYFKSLTKIKLSELIIDYLFQDNIYNVFINIKEMLRYDNNLDSPIVDEEHLKFYAEVLSIDEISLEDRITFYNKYKNENIASMFYDDIRLCKDHCYERINSYLFNVDSVDYDKELSERCGVPVIDMRDKEFYMLIRCIDSFEFKTFSLRGCYSIIKNDNLNVFSEARNIYGYTKLDKDYVAHLSERDLMSSDYLFNGVQVGSNYVNRLALLEEIMKNKTRNNEISILNKKDKDMYIAKKPDYLIALDNVGYIDIEEAKKLGIPIVLINKNYLYENDENMLESENYSYGYKVEDFNDYQNRRM